MTQDSRGLPSDRIITTAAARRDAVLDLIRDARSQITLSLFRCNDKAVFGELAAAVDRGVNVQVLVTSRAKGGKKKRRKLWSRLEDTRATVYAYTDPVVKYHAKYMVADDGPALITSLNFTRKCFDDTCDVVALTYDPAVVAGLGQLMRTDREGGIAPDTMPDRLIVGPERARRQFTALITQARTSIQIIDAKVSDPGLIQLLNARRAEGVSVEVYDQKFLAGMKSHGKMMLIDGTRAVIGSLALTALSLDFRREVALVVDEPSAVAEIERLFRFISEAPGATRTAPAAAAGGASC
jgi:phosphatidylserine/phosphatidylglycerophosphate/cardiolipin synthase-like enzyme